MTQQEKWIGICALVMLVPFMVFYTMAGFENRDWQQVYHYWDKSKDVLVFYTFYRIIKNNKVIPLAAFIFASIRLLWHIISSVTGVSINNHMWVNFLFATLVLICTIAVIKEWRKLN